MFRDSSAKMQFDNFGVGSVIMGFGKEDWLVVAASNTDHITLLNLTTMKLSATEIKVADVNHISSKEARELVNLTKYDWTFSDYEFDTKGLKRIKNED